VPVLDTTVAVYDDRADAESDWSALEAAAEAGQLQMADGALVENRNSEAIIWERQSHHGWGKGAVVGAVVGVLFPPSILGAAAVGAGGGALIARMTRSLGRGKVKDLGETLDSGAMAIIVVSPAGSTNAVCHALKSATTTTTVPSASAEEVEEILRAAR
jgi:uncharacterized membrane protein